MRTLAFSKRVAKEILRDPLTLIFGVGFPVILILLLTAIQANVPEGATPFALSALAPGMTVFSLSFITLFSSMLIARDRETAFLQRLYATPMRAIDFILGYTLPLIPFAFAQCAACFITAVILGLEISISMLYCALAILPAVVFFIGLGLLCGSVLNTRQVGGVCGALLTNLAAWLSGIWFDVRLVGGAFQKISELLPFAHAVEIERQVFAGNMSGLPTHYLWVGGYALAAMAAATALFLKQMRK